MNRTPMLPRKPALPSVGPRILGCRCHVLGSIVSEWRRRPHEATAGRRAPSCSTCSRRCATTGSRSSRRIRASRAGRSAALRRVDQELPERSCRSRPAQRAGRFAGVAPPVAVVLPVQGRLPVVRRRRLKTRHSDCKHRWFVSVGGLLGQHGDVLRHLDPYVSPATSPDSSATLVSRLPPPFHRARRRLRRRASSRPAPATGGGAERRGHRVASRTRPLLHSCAPLESRYANICSYGGDDPPRGSGLVLRVGRAARRPEPARAAGDRRRRRRPRGELRGEGLRRADADAPRPGAESLPAARSSSRRGWTPTPRRARRPYRVFDDISPFVEGLSIDEAFLDVRGMRRIAGEPVEIAERLRRAVRERVGLPITVGVARTKFLAKVASAVAKPDGLLLVAPDRELAFLHALPVERLWGVGTVTAEKLRSRGIRTVGQLAAFPRRRSRRCSAARRAATCTRSPTTATRAPSIRDGVEARSARSAHSAVRRSHRPRSTPSRSASSSASPDG